MLTPEEQQELKQLEAELSQQGQIQAQPQGNLTPEEEQELRQLEGELMAHRQAETSAQPTLGEALGAVSENIQNENQQYEKMQQAPEADLGFLNRARYSVEPIESNRRALLIQQFGQENVIEGPKGELYINQDGQIKPVNKSGVSVADFAELAGTAPEMIGGVIGLSGGPVGAAVGAMAGSAVRQGVSAVMGSPQVAGVGERALDIGISGALGAAGKVAGDKLKPVIKKFSGKHFKKIMPSTQGKRLSLLAKQEGITAPTMGQMVGGAARDQEKVLARLPIGGKKLKEQFEQQVSDVMNNLKKVGGDFVDVDSAKFETGSKLKSAISGKIKGISSKSSALFDEVTNEAQNIYLPSKELKGSFLSSIRGLKMFDPKGNPLKYKALSGIDKDTFLKVQGTLKDILAGFDDGARYLAKTSGKVVTGKEPKYLTPMQLDALRKTVDKNIKNFKNQNLDDYLLRQVREGLLDVTENSLGGADKALRDKFRLARSLWAEKYNLESIYSKGGAKGLSLEGLADEKILDKVFTDTKTLNAFKRLTDDATAADMGKKFVNELLKKNVNASGAIKVSQLRNALMAKQDVIKQTLGKKQYKSMMNNLKFLNEVNYNPNASGTSIVDMLTNPVKNITALATTKAPLAIRKKALALPEGLDKNTLRLFQFSGQDAKSGAGFGARKLFADDGKEKKGRKVANERK